MSKLQAAQVRSLKFEGRPRKVFDGGGLYLHIQKSGRYWRWKYRWHGREKLLALGVYPDVTLREARDRRDRARIMLRDGTDPSAARQAQKHDDGTFGALVAKWIKKNRPSKEEGSKKRGSWSEATLKQTKSRLDNDILPYLARRPVAELRAPELLAVSQRAVDRGAVETGRRLMRIMRQALQHAVIHGEIDHNPAHGLVEALPSAETQHMAAITDPEQVGELLRAIDGYQGEPVTRAALKFLPLVFVRPGELRSAEWPEIDLDAARWEIPAKKMKMGEPLIVPLSRQAVEILTDLRPIARGDLVFPSLRARGRPISDNTMNAALRRMGYSKDQMTAHGFRAMARTMLEEQEQLKWRYELIEQQLGHVVRDANGRAYNRTKHLPDRVKMMQAWADYLDNLR